MVTDNMDQETTTTTTTTNTSSTTDINSSIDYSDISNNNETPTKQPRKKRVVEHKPVEVKDVYTEEELQRLKKPQLFEICSNKNLHVIKSSSKSDLVDKITEYQNQVARTKRMLVDENPLQQYHRGTVDYALPPIIIVNIIKMVWNSYLHPVVNSKKSVSISHKSEYRQALQLATINKLMYQMISKTMFNRVSFNSHSMEDLSRHLKNPSCLLKSIESLKWDHHHYDDYFKSTNKSKRLDKPMEEVMFGKMDILHIVFYSLYHTVMTAGCLKEIKTVMPLLTKITFEGISLTGSHIDELMLIPSLRYLNVKYLYKVASLDALATKSTNIRTVYFPKDYHLHTSQTIVLSTVAMNSFQWDAKYTTNLKKIIIYGALYWNQAPKYHFDHVTHLAYNITSTKMDHIKSIMKHLTSLITLENCGHVKEINSRITTALDPSISPLFTRYIQRCDSYDSSTKIVEFTKLGFIHQYTKRVCLTSKDDYYKLVFTKQNNYNSSYATNIRSIQSKKKEKK